METSIKLLNRLSQVTKNLDFRDFLDRHSNTSIIKLVSLCLDTRAQDAVCRYREILISKLQNKVSDETIKLILNMEVPLEDLYGVTEKKDIEILWDSAKPKLPHFHGQMVITGTVELDHPCKSESFYDMWMLGQEMGPPDKALNAFHKSWCQRGGDENEGD
jgi:hypothetical protein